MNTARWLRLFAASALAVLAALGLTLAISHQASAASVTAIDAGGSHTCAITSLSVQCWGSNEYGQLGIGTTDPSSVPQLVSGSAGQVTAVAAGLRHTCALTIGGGVKCWGNNDYGQMGDGTHEQRLSPVDVSGLTNGVVAIAAGGFHTCALTAGGGVKCWGENGFGQLGDAGACGAVCLFPVNVTGLTSGVATISAGSLHTCAVTTDGAAKCWGTNIYGQLGDNQACGSFSCFVPASVIGLQVDVASISAGERHTCATTSASVQCWGDNDDGQLGDGTMSERHAPAPVCVDVSCTTALGAVEVSAGAFHTCALLSGGATMCWGLNDMGQVGVGNTMSPAVLPLALPAFPSGTNQVSAGDRHACARTATGVYCWGDNLSGQVGAATNETCGAPPEPCSTLPLTVKMDADMDGCLNNQELGGNAALGGMRNPKSFWDFFDTPTDTGVRDRIVSSGDLQRVVLRFGSIQMPAPTQSAALTQALSIPPPSGYHAAFDRSSPLPGSDPWDLNAPDGAISAGDILFEVIQFGHTCA